MGQIAVRSGSSFSNRGGFIHDIVRLHWHAKYDPNNEDYDLAVIQVSPDFTFSQSVKPITLPKSENSTEYLYGTAYGWGLTDVSIQYLIIQQLSLLLGIPLKRYNIIELYKNHL